MKKLFHVLILAAVLVAAPVFVVAARPDSAPIPQSKPQPPQLPDTMPDDVASTSYFPVLPYDAPPDAQPQLVPVATNHSIDGNHPGITRAIIVIHDFTRNAQDMLSTLSSLAGPNNGTTIIVAPQFLLDFDIARLTERLPQESSMFARWPLGGWENGGDSIARPPGKPISAFTVIDLLLVYFADKNYFPDLKDVVVAGHGAGGNFVQRYATASRAPDIVKPQGIAVRFLVADASSFLYPTSIRQKDKRGNFMTPNATSCPDYDNYPYGLHNLNNYARRVGVTAIKLGYAARNVTYITGEKVPDSDPMPDISCAAMMEGSDRATRAAAFNAYLRDIYGETLGPHQFITIPKAGYDAAALFGSSCGMAVLLGDGICTMAPISGARRLR